MMGLYIDFTLHRSSSNGRQGGDQRRTEGASKAEITPTRDRRPPVQRRTGCDRLVANAKHIMICEGGRAIAHWSRTCHAME